MSISFSDSRYSINGLIRTDSTAIQNLEKLCNAAGCWLTYDIHTGLWSVVINQAGVSAWSFDDGNIIGGINVSGTGLDALYNSVKVTYPHEDLKGNTDFIQITIPSEDRFPNEPDNILQMTYDIVTNPVQAQLLGFIELKQSRVDKIIKFKTDYSRIGVRAGDLIDVTATIYGFAAKLFRVVTVNEVDNDAGGIDVEIQALEYDADVYSQDFSRYTRSDENGILALGALPAPDAPTVVKYESDSRPRVDVSTQITGGVVERVEFWYTTDTAVSPDSSRNYQILAIQGPANGTSFTTGENIVATTDGLSSTNFYVKARAVNGQATSPFSDPSGLIEFVPEVVAQALDENTNFKGLLGLLGLLPLLQLLSNFLGNGSRTMKQKIGDEGFPQFSTFEQTEDAATVSTSYNAAVINTDWYDVGEYNDPAEYVVITLPLAEAVNQLLVIIDVPYGSWYYEYADAAEDILVADIGQSYIPTSLAVYYESTEIQSHNSDWQTNNIIVQLADAPAGDYYFVFRPTVTYDLDQVQRNNGSLIKPYDFTVNEQASGGGITLTAYAFFN